MIPGAGEKDSMNDLRPERDPQSEPLSLSEVVYTKLRKALMRAELKPHERLKVRSLALQMGTSETPVREALFQLAHEGAIEIRPRHYIRVRRLSVTEYTEIRDIRMNLEPLAAERALPHIDEAMIDGLAATHDTLVVAERSGDWKTALQANFDFHFGLYTRSGMPTLTEVLEGLWIASARCSATSIPTRIPAMRSVTSTSTCSTPCAPATPMPCAGRSAWTSSKVDAPCASVLANRRRKRRPARKGANDEFWPQVGGVHPGIVRAEPP